MPEPKADTLARSVQTLVAEKQAVAAKERRLVLRLGAVLVKIGYRIVPMAEDSSGRPARRRGRRRGRKGMGAAARKAVSRRMKAYWAKRRGRPAKVKAKRRGRRNAAQAAG